MALLTHYGYCPACFQGTEFVVNGTWLRDQYICTKCGSIPRQRALMRVLEQVVPSWREQLIHESSPIPSGASGSLARLCPRYFATQWFPDVKPGESKLGVRCENLEALTFQDNSIDIHISQDVLEHVFDPESVFREIARTLVPGGVHVFTTPLVNKHKQSQRCAKLEPNGEITHLMPPEYHGNPISADGSLVTWRWGYDICEFIHRASGLFTTMHTLEIHAEGIKAEYIEVLVTRKPR